MQLGLMVEGQNGLTWQRWIHILQLAERLAFPTVFRSDHYFIGRQQDSLEAYLSFAVAARETQRVRFGPLVSPVTFRSPVDVARMAAQLDALSGGRFVMGMGAGWNESEHRAYGISFPPLKERMDRLEEAIHVAKALWQDSPASYEGRYYRLEGADLLPKPPSGRPFLLIGGNGERRTLRLVAEHADEWNSTGGGLENYARRGEVLAVHCADIGRDPATIRRSLMTFGVIAPDAAALDAATERMMMTRGARPGTSLADFRHELRERGSIVGTTSEVLETLARYAELGVDEVLFQHIDFDSDEVPEYIATELAPQATALVSHPS